jgi:hypothetical protein
MFIKKIKGKDKELIISLGAVAIFEFALWIFLIIKIFSK